MSSHLSHGVTVVVQKDRSLHAIASCWRFCQDAR